eukprot:TRINITY_DN1714_c0_g2_i1.p1 TRINITY_DN1714_c0_g2~~TRINITY_DN1714_c0_g2_i1.p1  ORF type:complete len:205 (+),score=62.75 TRINITY_DN1714_c0_g2_i1:47-616(+)
MATADYGINNLFDLIVEEWTGMIKQLVESLSTTNLNTEDNDMLNIKQSSSKIIYSAPPSNIYESIEAFYYAINWTEPFIISLLCFHFFNLLLVLITRKNIKIQIVYWIILLIFGRLTEQFNNYGRSNWQNFTTQNYFDKNGIFMLIFWAAPILLICLGITVNFLVHCYYLLIATTKQKIELKKKKKKNK